MAVSIQRGIILYSIREIIIILSYYLDAKYFLQIVSWSRNVPFHQGAVHVTSNILCKHIRWGSETYNIVLYLGFWDGHIAGESCNVNCFLFTYSLPLSLCFFKTFRLAGKQTDASSHHIYSNPIMTLYYLFDCTTTH